MRNIGLDFGTTNSTISYFKERGEVKFPETFIDPDENHSYIPSVIAYREDNQPLIGKNAVGELTSSDICDSYENFKLDLDRDIIPGKNKSATQVMGDYIQNFLERYKRRNGVKELDSVVMTIPVAWRDDEKNKEILERIEGISDKLGGTILRLISEPVAAATYFCHEYKLNKEKNPSGKGYEGLIFVVDYGGGTLDITLCKADNNQGLTILAGEGTGEYGKTSGCAGVAFDEAVVTKLLEDYDFQGIQPGSQRFIRLRRAFEERKIGNSEDITEKMKLYFRYEGKSNQYLFSLGKDDKGNEVKIFCKHLDEAFKQVCEPELKRLLAKVMEDAGEAAYVGRKHFRVQLVGGFSNFVSVENAVREAFNSSTTQDDERFDDPYPQIDRALAISKGAALRANGPDEVYACKYSLGYVVFVKGQSDQWIERRIQVINQGIDIKEVAEPVFSEEWVRIKSGFGRVKVYGYSEKRPEGTCLVSEEAISQLRPNLDGRGKLYQVGFSVNRYQIPTVYFRDKTGKMTPTPLRKLRDVLEDAKR